mgnify:CR=1 FL=1
MISEKVNYSKNITIKIARKHGQKLGYSKPKIIVFEKSFHGRSIATISASANPLIKKGFEPLLDGFIRIPLNKIEKFNDPIMLSEDNIKIEEFIAETPDNVVLMYFIDSEKADKTIKYFFTQRSVIDKMAKDAAII